MRLIIIRYKVTFRNYCVITRCRYNIIYLKIWQLWCYEMSHSTRYNTLFLNCKAYIVKLNCQIWVETWENFRCFLSVNLGMTELRKKNLWYRIFFLHDVTVTIMMQWKKTYEIEICIWFQSH